MPSARTASGPSGERAFHGQAAAIVESLEHARVRHLTIICVSAVPDSATVRAADMPIVVSGPGEALGFGQFASRDAATTVLEALAAGEPTQQAVEDWRYWVDRGYAF